MWIASSAQRYVINGDSLSCFTDPDLRTIAIIINERNKLRDLLKLSETEKAYFNQELDAYRQIEADLTRVVALNDSIIGLNAIQMTQLSKQNKKLRWTNRIIIGGSLLVGTFVILRR